MRILLLLPVVLLLFAAALCAQPGAFDKAKLAWNLPWDADWVTAVSFVGPHRVAAGNNLGEILIWELPGESGGDRTEAGAPARRWIHAIAVSPDARWIAAADMAGQVQMWSLVEK
jgi:hypothetical protein